MEDLYEELVKNSPELKSIETAIEMLTDNRNDSTKNFNFYNDKNEGYFIQGKEKLNSIKDTLLKEKIKDMLEASNIAYRSKTTAHTKFIENINTKMTSLEDLHCFLKIKTTLAVMEKYQTNNLPSTKPLETYLKKIDNLTNKMDSLGKK